jgi:hypothetical protein
MRVIMSEPPYAEARGGWVPMHGVPRGPSRNPNEFCGCPIAGRSALGGYASACS